MGEETPVHEDRCYTHEEIQTLVNTADMKLKAIILLMVSSGCKLGALGMKVGHLKRMGDLYKISVYEGQKGRGKYYTFCTPEAAKAIDTYLQFRERCGENLNDDSPLFRKDFDVDFHEAARNHVIPASYHSIRMDIFHCLLNSGIRTIDHINSFRNRKDVKMTHGFRKFFETQLVNAKLHEVIIRKLTGHSERDNLTQLYSKQTPDELYTEYEKSIDLLTINSESRLRRKVEKLEAEKSQFERLAAKIAAYVEIEKPIQEGEEQAARIIPEVTERDIDFVIQTIKKETSYDEPSIKQLFYGMNTAFTKLGMGHKVNPQDSGAFFRINLMT
jgi:hypothetical protein